MSVLTQLGLLWAKVHKQLNYYLIIFVKPLFDYDLINVSKQYQ